MSIKRSIQALYDQNILQEKQTIELAHYLNVTYGHVHTNRLVINELNIKVTTLNKTLMVVIGETKFIKYTVAILTDMRITLAQLSLGVISLQENVNAIYEYMRVLSTRRVNPLIIPELVMRVPAPLVTTKSSDQGIPPPPPPPRGFTLPTRRILLAKSTEHLTEALKEESLDIFLKEIQPRYHISRTT